MSILHLTPCRYDIEADKWTTLASIGGRIYATIANLSGKLYVIGGLSNSKTFLSSVECYDPAINAWSNVAPMISKRSKARAGVVNGHIYVVGGTDSKDESNNLSTIERYDQQKNEWTMVRASVRLRLHL